MIKNQLYWDINALGGKALRNTFVYYFMEKKNMVELFT